MKTLAIYQLPVLLLATFVLTISSCKKDDPVRGNPDEIPFPECEDVTIDDAIILRARDKADLQRVVDAL